MQEEESKSDFMKTIEDIRSTEKEAGQIVMHAKAKADEILRKAKENVARIRAETEETSVKVENERLRHGRADIEKEVESLLKTAREEAGQFKNKKLGDKALSELLETLLS